MNDLIARLRGTGQWVTLAALSIAGYLILAATSGGNLLSGQARHTFFLFLAVPIVIGLAQMVVLAVGQLNLAVGALGGMLAVAMGVLMADHGWPMPLALAVGVGGGALVGALIGLVVVATRVNGFIITLASLTILSGLQYRIVGTRTVADYSPGLSKFGRSSVFDIPYMFLIALAVAAIVGWFYRSTIAGRQLLASGGNPVAARLSGISNDRAIVTAYALSGLLIGIAAVITLAITPGVNRSIGGDWLLPSFAAPIIGGVALTGGAVAVLGTVFATVIVRLVDTARAQYSLESSWVNFIVGGVMLITVIVSTTSDARAARRAASGRIGTDPEVVTP